jgi:hypothetical protein
MKNMLLFCLALTPLALQADPGCQLQNGTVTGIYGVRNSGTALIGGGSAGVPIAAVGIATFDGRGNVQISFTGSFNGTIFKGLLLTGVYTINLDCTGSITLNPGASHFDIVVNPNGNQIDGIQTDTGSVTTQAYVRHYR